MVMFSAGMAISLFLDAYYHVPYAKEIGFTCVVASLGVLIILVFKLRKLFKGDMSGLSGPQEKTWRSYSHDRSQRNVLAYYLTKIHIVFSRLRRNSS
jgi:hypothetical protein